MKWLRENAISILIAVVCVALGMKLLGPGTHALTGKPAPDFTLPNLTGEEVSLANHRGKDVVVLDFWASWCPPCREGLPVLDRVAKRYADKPVAVYAVNIRESPNLVAEFAKAQGLTLPILLDDTGVIADDYGVTGIPQTVVIGRDGVIREIRVGMSMWGFEEELAAEIDAALATQTAASPG